MKFQKIKLSRDASNRLRSLKGATGITPNVLCRFALMSSLEDPTPVQIGANDSDGLEINRPTLLGDHDQLYVAFLKQRCIGDGVDVTDDATVYAHLLAHINRGIARMPSNFQGPESLLALAP